MAEIRVASIADIPLGSGKVVHAEGKMIALFHIEGEFYALENTCPHAGGPLGEGYVDDAVVTCPWHGWQFNIKTGQSVMIPTAKQKTYPVVVRNGEVFVDV